MQRKDEHRNQECPKQCKFQTLHSNIALSESIVCLSFRHRTKGRLHWEYFNVLRLALRLTSAYNFTKKETLVHVFSCEFCVISIVIVMFLLLALSKYMFTGLIVICSCVNLVNKIHVQICWNHCISQNESNFPKFNRSAVIHSI